MEGSTVQYYDGCSSTNVTRYWWFEMKQIMRCSIGVDFSKKKIDFKIQDETHFPFFLLVNTFWKFQVALCIQYNGGLEV